MPSLKLILAGAVLLSTVAPASRAANDPFADTIRKTDPRDPEQERLGFHLPPGFEAQLVASEPDINKVMNMAFDAKGRLWVTQSREYPFPVLPVEKPGRDKVLILEDFDANGHARKITTFKDGLNIPIGLYPYKDGVIAFSIPYIHYFQDTDGDGKADKDEIILGKQGFDRDTHGLTSSFRRGYDGWMYAEHGFNNNTTLTAKDGSTITMNSGNCYRFKIDGSHVEQHSWGQVNPFGLMFDPLGDLWSSDCHSSPTYILLHGGYIPSFGKANDGLGFEPEICRHSHGSTAIAGMIYYAATNFPKEYWGNTFIGNVMTCRINRDSYPEQGSTRLAKEEPDFLSADDPWYRPVALELGPDGAIYMADFYNRIIGHYEVPLNHPGRDHERGRIWRIVYKGNDSSTAKDLNAQLKLPTDVDGLIAELGNPNIKRRFLATDELTDRIGAAAIKPVTKMMHDKKSNASQRVHGMWILYRLGALDEKTLITASKDSDRQVRVHAMRVLAEMPTWSSTDHDMALKGLQDKDAFVQRCAADALGRHPSFDNIRPLLRLRQAVPAVDEELVYESRMSLRNQLLPAGNLPKLEKTGLSEADSRTLADVAIGATNEDSAVFLLHHLQKFDESHERLTTYLHHVTRFVPVSEMDSVAKFTQTKFAEDVDFQLTLFKSVQEALTQRGAPISEAVRNWGAELTEKMLASVDVKKLDWRNTPIKDVVDATNPWGLEPRSCSDGKTVEFISSFAPGGESLTGILRSRDFVLPKTLSFYVCGHDGSPEKPPGKKNYVRILETKTGKLIKEVPAPRNDVAQKITWTFPNRAGQKAYLEVVDRNNGHSYAWIAISRLEPQVVPMPTVVPNHVDRRQQFAAELIGTLHLENMIKPLTELLLNSEANAEARAAAAKALASMNANSATTALQEVAANPHANANLREASAKALAEMNSAESRKAVIEAMRTAPQSMQVQIALALTGKPEGAEALLAAVEDGKASARLLQDRNVKDRLTAAKPADVDARIEKLTKNLPKADAERQKIIDERVAKFDPAKASAKLGAQVFKNNCSVCHTLDGHGGLIGPQLDGVGNRGADRIVEDVLDPSRNVDRAFRTSLVIKNDGDVESGLFRREEGATIVLAQSTGKEIAIPKSEVKERRESETSLMPDNFYEIISPADFNNLLAYLLDHGTKSSAKK